MLVVCLSVYLHISFFYELGCQVFISTIICDCLSVNVRNTFNGDRQWFNMKINIDVVPDPLVIRGD